MEERYIIQLLDNWALHYLDHLEHQSGTYLRDLLRIRVRLVGWLEEQGDHLPQEVAGIPPLQASQALLLRIGMALERLRVREGSPRQLLKSLISSYGQIAAGMIKEAGLSRTDAYEHLPKDDIRVEHGTLRQQLDRLAAKVGHDGDFTITYVSPTQLPYCKCVSLLGSDHATIVVPLHDGQVSFLGAAHELGHVVSHHLARTAGRLECPILSESFAFLMEHLAMELFGVPPDGRLTQLLRFQIYRLLVVDGFNRWGNQDDHLELIVSLMGRLLMPRLKADLQLHGRLTMAR